MYTWVYGKVEPGWYMAMYGYLERYKSHLESLGYKIIIAPSKPEE